MIAYIFGHATFNEILWALIGAVGVTSTILNIRDVERNIEAVKALNGQNLDLYQPMLILGHGHLRNEVFRLAKCCTILMLALLLWSVPNSTNTTASILITIALFILMLLIVIPGILDKRQRIVMAGLSKRMHESE